MSEMDALRKDNLELQESRAELAMWRARQRRMEITGVGAAATHPDRRGGRSGVSGESHGMITTWARLGGAPQLATGFAVSASVGPRMTPLPTAASTTHVTTRAEPGLPPLDVQPCWGDQTVSSNVDI